MAALFDFANIASQQGGGAKLFDLVKTGQASEADIRGSLGNTAVDNWLSANPTYKQQLAGMNQAVPGPQTPAAAPTPATIPGVSSSTTPPASMPGVQGPTSQPSAPASSGAPSIWQQQAQAYVNQGSITPDQMQALLAKANQVGYMPSSNLQAFIGGSTASTPAPSTTQAPSPVTSTPSAPAQPQTPAPVQPPQAPTPQAPAPQAPTPQPSQAPTPSPAAQPQQWSQATMDAIARGNISQNEAGWFEQNYGNPNYQKDTAIKNMASQQGGGQQVWEAVQRGQFSEADAVRALGQDEVNKWKSTNSKNLTSPGANAYTPPQLQNTANDFARYPTEIPQQPNYQAAAEAQGNANYNAARQTVNLQNPDVYNPYGSQTVQYDANGRPILSQNLSPDMQARLNQLAQMQPDQFRRIMQGLAPEIGSYNFSKVDPFSSDSLSDKPTLANAQNAVDSAKLGTDPTLANALASIKASGLQDFTGYTPLGAPSEFDKGYQGYGIDPINTGNLGARQVGVGTQGQSAVAEALRQREQPRFDRARQKAEADLLARGFNPGTEGYNERMDELTRSENDFNLGLTALSGQEHSRLFDMESSLRGQGLGEMLAQQQSGLSARQQGLTESSTIANYENQLRQMGMNEQQIQAGINSMIRGQQSGEISTAFDIMSGLRGQKFNELNQTTQTMQGNRQLSLAEALQKYNQQTGTRGREIEEQLLARQLPMQEYGQLQQLLQPQLPQFNQWQGSSVESAPLFNAINAQGLFDLSRYGTAITGELGTRGIDASKGAANTGALLGLLGLG